MNDATLLQDLNVLIDHYITKNGYKPNRVLIGYKAYTVLMHDQSFARELTDSAIEPNKRKYRKIKIKLTKDDNQLELE
ncbi:hypothetical protein F3J02_11120 [Acinetobacter sp. Tr-809]|uniref:hypothetical protein n=1 Tax=Acinetobacter sp. Tr-809 TaxID=2608324 RepID=UPI00141EF9B0|nr:hypothetical protein [Acinetobacter sp. Tr-809]NIE97019.1 hypothetical protein [Acinetobacter sp. Tr-809]